MHPTDSIHPGSPLPQRTRPLAEAPALAQRAAQLLRTPQAFVTLTPDEAQVVVGYMRLASFAQGSVVIREGDETTASYLLLLLDGEVAVDAGYGQAVPISVVGPGSVIGEMALIDGAPRSATCTAMSPVTAAGLGRRGLELLLDEHPRIAARLMIGLTQRIADRLRALSQQLHLLSQVVPK